MNTGVNDISPYCITPTTEALARKVAAGNQPAPVTRWELPALPAATAAPHYDDDDEDDHDDADDDDDEEPTP